MPLQGRRVNASPATNFSVGVSAVVGRLVAGIKFTSPEGVGDGFLLDRKAGDGQ